MRIWMIGVVMAVAGVLTSTSATQRSDNHSSDAGQTLSYGFDNWSEPIGSLTWEHYASAFYNLELDYTASSSLFDKLIYDNVAAMLAGGHCFGMSLQSLAMNQVGGYRGFCCPTGLYGGTSSGGPADNRLRDVIKEMHCHQLSQACILTYIDQIDSRVARNGQRMLDMFEAALANEETVLANITKSIEPLAEGAIVAHSVIAYRVERTSPTSGKIYIVDPNRCWYYNTGSDSADHHGWYQDNLNYIEIQGTKWRYVGSVSRHDAVVQWPVNDINPDDVSNGFLICLPGSRVAPAGRSLASLGLALGNISAGAAEVLEMMYISGANVSLSQIATPDGYRVFDPATGTYEEDDQKRLSRVVPIPIAGRLSNVHDGVNRYSFASDRRHDTISYEFTTGADGASVTSLSSGTAFAITVRARDARVRIEIEGVGSPQPTVRCTSTNAADIHVECVRMTPTRMARQLRVEGRVTPGREEVWHLPVSKVLPVRKLETWKQ